MVLRPDDTKLRYSTFTHLSSLPAFDRQIINDNYKKSVPQFEVPVAHNLNDNFMLYAGQARTIGDDEGGKMYANLDATYLMSIGYQVDVPQYTGKCARTGGLEGE